MIHNDGKNGKQEDITNKGKRTSIGFGFGG
jgi:hypothetical protein